MECVKTESVKTNRILRAAIGLLTVALVYVIYAGIHQRVVVAGDSAPEFTILAENGRAVSVPKFGGKLLVLNFWATWCPPCVEEMPSLVEMQRRMKAKGITVLAVSVDVDQGAYLQFLKEHNVNLLTVRDPGQKSNALYGTFRFPETYVIDRNGVMRRKFVGGVDWTAPDITEFLGRM